MPTLAPLSPDIVVVNPNGEYLILIEVKLNTITHEAEEQLKRLMVSMACSVGLLVSRTKIIFFRDSLKESDGTSIKKLDVVELPQNLFILEDKQNSRELAKELESKVQQWLENIQFSRNVNNLSSELKELLESQVVPLLQIGEIRAAHPRFFSS